MKSFEELGLSEPLLAAIKEQGYTAPTPIQAATIPVLLGNSTDYSGMAATGTGKTAAFGIPLLESIDPALRATQAVVLCPTRELAIQVCEQLTILGKHKSVHAQAIYGGTGYSEQIRGLKRGAYILVATPGRLVDHIESGNVKLEHVKTLVLDEADEMISMGFKDALEFLLKQFSNADCRRWMFAATMNAALKRVADTYLRNAKSVRVNSTEMLSGTVEQKYFVVREMNKAKAIAKLIDLEEGFYGLIFCPTKVIVVALTEFLRGKGFKVDCLHGDKTQFERERTLTALRERTVNIVVCSDVAARGLDVKELTHVINYSLPDDLDSYVHRIGRTGRSGRTGVAYSLVAPSQTYRVSRVEKITRSKMTLAILPSKKELSSKKLARLLPTFVGEPRFSRALQILTDEWKQVLEGLSKEEIAARFLAMSQPDLFDENADADDSLFGQSDEPGGHYRERRGPNREFRHGRDSRGPRRTGGGGFGKPRGFPGRRFGSGEATAGGGPGPGNGPRRGPWNGNEGREGGQSRGGPPGGGRPRGRNFGGGPGAAPGGASRRPFPVRRKPKAFVGREAN